jgi:hypothetical protein
LRRRQEEDDVIKRKIVMGLLVLGTIGGFAAGFRSMHRGCSADRSRHAQWEDHVADVCVRAAKNAETTPAAREGDSR